MLRSIKNLGIPGNFFESSFESASRIQLFKFDVCTFEWFQKVISLNFRFDSLKAFIKRNIFRFTSPSFRVFKFEFGSFLQLSVFKKLKQQQPRLDVTPEQNSDRCAVVAFLGRHRHNLCVRFSLNSPPPPLLASRTLKRTSWLISSFVARPA